MSLTNYYYIIFEPNCLHHLDENALFGQNFLRNLGV